MDRNGLKKQISPLTVPFIGYMQHHLVCDMVIVTYKQIIQLTVLFIGYMQDQLVCDVVIVTDKKQGLTSD